MYFFSIKFVVNFSRIFQSIIMHFMPIFLICFWLFLDFKGIIMEVMLIFAKYYHLDHICTTVKLENRYYFVFESIFLVGGRNLTG